MYCICIVYVNGDSCLRIKTLNKNMVNSINVYVYVYVVYNNATFIWSKDCVTLWIIFGKTLDVHNNIVPNSKQQSMLFLLLRFFFCVQYSGIKRKVG